MGGDGGVEGVVVGGDYDEGEVGCEVRGFVGAEVDCDVFRAERFLGVGSDDGDVGVGVEERLSAAESDWACTYDEGGLVCDVQGYW